ncbi:hypothetical protein HY251_14535 [bacterium]|nr:hypothetical protein [bacterium]
MYRDAGWLGWGDWLGTGTVATRRRRFRSFSAARRYALDLHLRNQLDWHAFCRGDLAAKRPMDVPRNPDRVYRDSWKSWGDWLGTGAVASRDRTYRPFEQARTFVRRLGLRSRNEWQSLVDGDMPARGTLPQDIPRAPHLTYAGKGWTNWGDWLGTGRVNNRERTFVSFEEARKLVRGLGLKSVAEWRACTKGALPGVAGLPDNVPRAPEVHYQNDGWRGYGDWLGTGTIAPSLRRYRPFKDARRFARSLRLDPQDSRRAWREFCRRARTQPGLLPADIPAAPHAVYTDEGWKSYADWLGRDARRARSH